MLRSGLAPKPFSCFGSSERLIYSMSLTRTLVLYSICNISSSAFVPKSSEEQCLQSKKNWLLTEQSPSELLILLYSSVKFGLQNTGALWRRGDDKARQLHDSVCVGSRYHPDLKHIKTSAVVIGSKIAARFVLRLIRLAHSDYSWTIRSPQLADTTDNSA